MRQEFLPLGYSEEGEEEQELQICDAREHHGHVKGQSVNNKKNKTSFKTSMRIYICVLEDLERSWLTTRLQEGHQGS